MPILLMILTISGILAHLPDYGFAFTMEEKNTIAAYEKVAPSIVNITTKACEPESFFCALPSEGSGSGIILKQDGLIVTNYHVVANSENIEVALEDGSRFSATVIGRSPHDDLAIIKIDPQGHSLQPAVFGNPKDLHIGEKVLAIGNPFGLGQTLTVGTVSMTGRDVKNDGHTYRDLIQTDASINPGNSGGALVNSRGEVVGMNTIILSPTGSSIGIGFAIPASRIEKAVPGIMNPWDTRLVWILAVALVLWLIRRIYRVGR